MTAATQDLTAARQRIAELEANLTAINDNLKAERETARRAGITYDAVRGIMLGYEREEVSFGRIVEQLRELCLANTRIAELEDWQRRASAKFREVSSPGYCGDPHLDQGINRLLSEVKP